MIEALFALFVVLQIADGFTTLKVLQAGGVELNPIIRKAIDKFGQRSALLGKTIVAIVLVGVIMPYITWHVLAVLCTFYTGIAVNNLRVLHKLRK